MMCGIVDLGSNTIRLSIYQYEGEHFRLLLNKKTMAGLAGYVQDGALSDGGILVACRVLSSYRALLSNFSVSEMHVFATASLRNISNTGEAVEAIRDVTGVTVEVLDGETEAALSFKGAVLPGGVPTGLLLENAIIEASGRLPVPTEDQVRESLVRAIAEYNKKGFTTFQDGGLGINGEAEVFLRPYMELAREGRLNARAYLQLLPSEMDKLIPLGLWGIGNDHMKIGGVKYFTDGSIQGFTGALLEDYYTRPGYKGALLWSQEEIDEIIIKYHCLGFQVAVHTNGDAASESVIQAFEKAVERCPRTDLRHMLIHAQLVSDSQLERMKACGIIPSLFARHIEVWGDRHAAIFLGPERTARMDPAGSCVRLDMPFSLHVDTPVLPVTALGSMHAAVNRISDGGVLFGGDQRITPRQALEAYTTYASLCCGGEHDRGRIEPGRFADFVLLDSDIEAIDPSGIRDIKVLKTICGGRVVYEA